MKCNTCGRQPQNEEANFCEYCGASFREHTHAIINSAPREQRYKDTADQMPGRTSVSAEKPIPYTNWFGWYGLLLIPVVGWLVFFVLLFVWSFDDNIPKSKKRWARVNLILAIIIVTLVVVYTVAVVTSPMFQNMYVDMLRQMRDGTFDYNSYLNSINQTTN